MDVEAYLKRIGFKGELSLTYETLHALHIAHAFTIPFENLKVLFKEPITLKEELLFEKIVLNRRGGYCYELNMLFSLLLSKIGFNVANLIARPMFGFDYLHPKTHMILKVNIDEQSYLADLGFGGVGLIAPLLLSSKEVAYQFNEKFRLIENSDGFELHSYIANRWTPLYSFDLDEQKMVDYELPNYYSSTSPNSKFTNMLICSMPTLDGRLRLVDGDFKERTSKRSNIKISSAQMYIDVLSEHFGIFIEDSEADRLFKRLATPHSPLQQTPNAL